MVADTASFVKKPSPTNPPDVGSVGVASSPWYPLFRSVTERQFRVDGHVYLLEDGKLRTSPRWATVIAVVDCAHYGQLCPM